MPDLKTLQSRFAEALLTPGAVPDGLFAGSPDMAARRFSLYRGNLTANWERSLGNAYPVLQRLLGAEFFRGLAREYGRAVPLAAGDLNRFGDRLPEFLETFEPVAEYPYMPDVARLELALHRAHYATDSPVANAAALAALDAEALGALRFRLPAACTLLYSRWAVVGIWQAHQPRGQWPPDISANSRALTFRRSWRGEVLGLSPGEFAGLEAIGSGETLGAALETAQDAEAEFDPAVALPRWLAAGALAPPASSHP